MFSEAEKKRIESVKEVIKMEIKPGFLIPVRFHLSTTIENNFFISGGCIASLLQGEEVNDYDVYFKFEETMNSVKNLFVNSMKSEIEDVNEKYREVLGKDGKLITENAVTLKNKVQLITKHFGSPEEIRKTFDFVHCTPYYDIGEDKLYISRKQFDAIINKKLILVNKENGVSHSARVDKFRKRGYQWH